MLDGLNERLHVERDRGSQSVSPPARAVSHRADIHEAFLSLRCTLNCWQSLRRTWTTV